MARRRISKELKDIRADLPYICTAVHPANDDLFYWKATISGPINTPYYGGLFDLEIIFPKDYPFEPPKVKLLTKMYHPNVNEAGYICTECCLHILADLWSPALTISKVLLVICSVINNPNPNCGLNQKAGKLYTENRQRFNQIARNWTVKYALGPDLIPLNTLQIELESMEQNHTQLMQNIHNQQNDCAEIQREHNALQQQLATFELSMNRLQTNTETLTLNNMNKKKPNMKSHTQHTAEYAKLQKKHALLQQKLQKHTMNK